MLRLLEEWRENLYKNFVVEGVLMDLSKAFDCVPHDNLFGKPALHGVDFLYYKHSYLVNQKQCVRIDNVNSEFLNDISSVPQGFIVGSILFSCFFYDFTLRY